MSPLQTAIQSLVKELTIERVIQGADPAIPRGPFSELMRMVAHYGVVPSCEGCKYGGLQYPIKGGEGKPFIFCEIESRSKPPIDVYGKTILVREHDHFCAAWEPGETK